MLSLNGHTDRILGAVYQCKELRKNTCLATKLMLLGLSTACSTIFKFAFQTISIRFASNFLSLHLISFFKL